ncbi:MAG: hypothetical protein ABJJ53_18505 [Sulfitobacter sp.]
MLKFNGLAVIAAIGFTAVAPQTASADVKIRPYKTSHNFCAAGMQPVSINGVICCGVPNTNISYQSAMAHPVAKKKVHKKTYKPRATRSYCAVGTKGCTFD